MAVEWTEEEEATLSAIALDLGIIAGWLPNKKLANRLAGYSKQLQDMVIDTEEPPTP